MVKTGNGILEIFSLLAIVLPVIPLFLLFFKNIYSIPVIALLAIACMLGLAESVFSLVDMNPVRQRMAIELFRAVDCTIILIIYRVTATNKRLADIFSFLVISLFSIIAAIYITSGTGEYASKIKIIQSVLMIAATLLAFSQLINRRDLLLFESTLFWVGAATFFYYSMLLLIEEISTTGISSAAEATADKSILIYLVHFVRYLFYIIAVVITHRKVQDNRFT